MTDSSEHATSPVTLREAFRVWFKIGILSFGGPAAQIALMHKMVVAERGWLSEKQFLSALSFCMLLPGPEAMQLATYAGWRMHGTRGGLMAGLLFIIPGALIVLFLAIVYAWLGQVPLVNSLFLGVKAVVVIIVVQALLRLAGKALISWLHLVIAFIAFIEIYFLQLPFPWIIFSAAVIGAIFPDLISQPRATHDRPTGGHSTQGQSSPGTARSVSASNINHTLNPDAGPKGLAATVKTLCIWLCLWLLPFALFWLMDAPALFTDIGSFFSRLAVVTFGGAYAVLAYLAQDVVLQFGWLTAEEVMDGLGLAETTPGPLILVTEFVGFLVGYREGGLMMGVAAAAITLWVTFVPCFLWILTGAPYIEWLTAQSRLSSALSAITAAVVGVILNLSVWFALHVLFEHQWTADTFGLSFQLPSLYSLDWRAAILTLVSGVLLLHRHWNIVPVLLISAVAGLLVSAF